MDIETYQRLGLHKPYGDDDFVGHVVNGHTNQEIQITQDAPGDRQYHLFPEACPDETVPRGKVISFLEWAGSREYPHTRRDMWVYTPNRLDPQGEPPALIVFNDSLGYLDPHGSVWATKVLDSLVHAGDIPNLVRSTERKPIRVFLHSGEADANIVSGNWPLANQQMAAALAYAGYDMQFAFGQGGHTFRHGGAIFADSLRWLFRG
jgi:hypothetical protein